MSSTMPKIRDVEESNDSDDTQQDADSDDGQLDNDRGGSQPDTDTDTDSDDEHLASLVCWSLYSSRETWYVTG